MIDDRVRCLDCRALLPNGACRIAKARKRLDVWRGYGPAHPELRVRCPFFWPKKDDPDQRLGPERFPDLYAEYKKRFAA